MTVLERLDDGPAATDGGDTPAWRPGSLAAADGTGTPGTSWLEGGTSVSEEAWPGRSGRRRQCSKMMEMFYLLDIILFNTHFVK